MLPTMPRDTLHGCMLQGLVQTNSTPLCTADAGWRSARQAARSRSQRCSQKRSQPQKQEAGGPHRRPLFSRHKRQRRACSCFCSVRSTQQWRAVGLHHSCQRQQVRAPLRSPCTPLLEPQTPVRCRRQRRLLRPRLQRRTSRSQRGMQRSSCGRCCCSMGCRCKSGATRSRCFAPCGPTCPMICPACSTDPKR